MTRGKNKGCHRDNHLYIFRYYVSKEANLFDDQETVHIIGVLFDKPSVNVNPYGDFVEYKFHLYQSLSFYTTITLVCGLQAQQIPRLHFMPLPVGKCVIVKFIDVIGVNELYLDTRVSDRLQIGVLNLSRFRTDLEAYCKYEKEEEPISLDHQYCMNMDVDSFPNWQDEIEAFRDIANFVRRCQRVVMLCKYNPSLAQSSEDSETKFICDKLIVSQ